MPGGPEPGKPSQVRQPQSPGSGFTRFRTSTDNESKAQPWLL